MQNLESTQIAYLPNTANNNTEKLYLVCIEFDDPVENIWYFFNDRETLYAWLCIKFKDEEVAINPHTSFILVNGVKLEDRKSVYMFMKYCESIYNYGFNIDDFTDVYNDDNSNREVYNNDFTSLTMSDLMKKSTSISSYQDINISED